MYDDDDDDDDNDLYLLCCRVMCPWVIFDLDSQELKCNGPIVRMVEGEMMFFVFPY